MWWKNLKAAVNRVCPVAFDPERNVALKSYFIAEMTDRKAATEVVTYACAYIMSHQIAESDDTALIRRAFQAYEQQGEIDFDDNHTEQALARTKAVEEKRLRQRAGHLAYLKSQETLTLTDEQKAKIAAKDFKFTHFGTRVKLMMQWLPNDPQIVFQYRMFGTTWGASGSNDNQIINSWIRNGIVEVVQHHPFPTAARLRLGPNAERAFKEFKSLPSTFGIGRDIFEMRHGRTTFRRSAREAHTSTD